MMTQHTRRRETRGGVVSCGASPRKIMMRIEDEEREREEKIGTIPDSWWAGARQPMRGKFKKQARFANYV